MIQNKTNNIESGI